VLTTGRGLLVSSLKKRVESLCRTLGATGGQTSAASLAPVVFFHEQHDPNMEGMCSFGALVLEEWRRSSIAGLRATAVGATHRPAMGMLFEEPAPSFSPQRRADRLARDILIRTHGDSWGMLAPHGTPLPLYRTRTFELLNRSPAESVEGSGRFSITSGIPSGLLHSEMEICSYLADASLEHQDPQPLCNMDVWLPKLSAPEGGASRFSVTLDLRMCVDGEVTVCIVHEASGTVLQKRSGKHLELVRCAPETHAEQHTE
jgi:hypothetical protein